MTRLLSFLLFITLALSIVGLAHYYVWARLIRDTALPRPAYQILTALVVLAGLSIPATFWASHSLAPGPSRPILLASYFWLGLLMLLVVLLAGSDLVRFAIGFYHRWRDLPIDTQRRTALARLFAGAVGIGASALGGIGSLRVLSGFVIKEVEVTLGRLPRELDGFTIVQLTDMHLGPTLHVQFAEEVVRRANELGADLVAITGDLVDGSVEALGPMVESLRKLRSRHGTFFVTGNHEYYSGASEWVAHLRRMGIRVLENERVEIGHGGASFDLAGVNDHSAARTDPSAAPDYERALSRSDISRELVLLAHQPKAVFDAARFGVGLLLAGHTHGGQVWPWNYLVPLQQPVVAGLESIEGTLVYVSSGTGYWGPPMRLGTTAEITKIVLRSRA